MLPLAPQQAAGAFARQIRCIAPCVARSHAFHGSSLLSAKHREAGRSSAAPPAAITDQPGVLPDEQGNLPHVSVLLNEVLSNLNHMPIKVSARHKQRRKQQDSSLPGEDRFQQMKHSQQVSLLSCSCCCCTGCPDYYQLPSSTYSPFQFVMGWPANLVA